MSLLGEIKRRKVFQVAVVYAVVAWLIIQIIDVVSEPLSLPGWIDTVVIVLLAVGFPIAVILAWAFDLTPEGVKADSGIQASHVTPQAGGQRLNYFLQGLVLVAVGFLVVDQYMLEPRASSTAVSSVSSATEPQLVNRFAHSMSDDQTIRRPGRPAMALSPNGRHFVFNTFDGLYLRTMGELEARLIPGTEPDMSSMSISPNGQAVAYWTGSGQLERIAISGGAPELIAGVASNPLGVHWEEDDTILIGQPEGILRVSATGGRPELIIPSEGDRIFHLPRLLPDGDSVLFSMGEFGEWDAAQIVVQSLSTGERTVLVERGNDARYLPTGHLVFALGDGLFAVAFDLDSLTVTGGAVPLVQGVRRPGGTGAADFGVADDGTLVYVKGRAGLGVTTLVWVDRDGSEEPINAPLRGYWYAQLSPDGTRIAVSDFDEEADTWIFNREREALQRLTTDPAENRNPIWSPDGQRVAFSQEVNGVQEIYWQVADGSADAEPLTEGSVVDMVPSDISPDGTALLYTPEDPPSDIWMVPLGGPATAGTPLLATPADERSASVSPDGQWLAYQSDESGQDEVYVRPFPDVNTGLTLISTGGGSSPIWSRDGRELFYYLERPGPLSDVVMAVSIDAELTFSPGVPEMLFQGEYLEPADRGQFYDVSLDGQQFLMIRDPGRTSEDERPLIIIVQNWFEELNRLAPASE